MNISKIMLIMSLLYLACSSSSDSPDEPDRQYASFVIGFSTEYNPPPEAWSSEEALGSPDVYPNHGDIDEAWASLSEDDQREYIELGYETAQTVAKIEIYETYNPGAIDTVYLRNVTTSQWLPVWQGSAFVYGDSSRIFEINISETRYKADAIRIALNSPVVPGWNEIDAIAISSK